MPDLIHLDLSQNLLSDISALAGLTNLQSLRLSFNQISDISTLSDLSTLHDLFLIENQISDISALENLTKLDLVNLMGNPSVTSQQAERLQAKLPDTIVQYGELPEHLRLALEAGWL